jgi:hypothetical protein
MEIKHSPDEVREYTIDEYTTLRFYIYEYPTKDKPHTLLVQNMSYSDEWRIIFQCYSLTIAEKVLKIYTKMLKKG